MRCGANEVEKRCGWRERLAVNYKRCGLIASYDRGRFEAGSLCSSVRAPYSRRLRVGLNRVGSRGKNLSSTRPRLASPHVGIVGGAAAACLVGPGAAGQHRRRRRCCSVAATSPGGCCSPRCRSPRGLGLPTGSPVRAAPQIAGGRGLVNPVARARCATDRRWAWACLPDRLCALRHRSPVAFTSGLLLLLRHGCAA